MRTRNYFLTEKDKENIWQMFFGPYKEEWKDSKGIVDNHDITISKRLKMPKDTVCNYITERLNNHFKKFNNGKK